MIKSVDYSLMEHVDDGSEMRNIWKYVLSKQEVLLRNATNKEVNQEGEEPEATRKEEVLLAVMLISIIVFGSCIDSIVDMFVGLII